jgi:hypothetical protein
VEALSLNKETICTWGAKPNIEDKAGSTGLLTQLPNTKK